MPEQGFTVKAKTMNALFLTQSGALNMFYMLMRALQGPLKLDKVGFYAASYNYFSQFRQRVPDIDSGKYILLKEWEITAKARSGKPDLELIREYEKKLGNPNLWGPLVADRRIYLGKNCTFRQDYSPRFNHSEMLNILQAGLVRMERLFDQVKPDFVISFVCVTFGEYLAYLFAKSRGIPILNLQLTRIKNYVTYGNSIFIPSQRIRAAYQERYRQNNDQNEWAKQAGEYIKFARKKHALYEGVTVPAQPAGVPLRKLYRRLRDVFKKEYAYRFAEVRDNHDPGVLIPFIYRQFLNPLRAAWIQRRLAAGYVSEDELRSMDYVYFPLHVEPEVALLVYSRSYLNQIEVIRNISHNIPVGMTLIVSEHPVTLGKRPLSYYKKILSIPNVRLAEPGLKSSIIKNARLVATIRGGGVGWEAVIRQKPVVIFSHAMYEFLPASMVRRLADPERLGEEIADLMQNYKYDENAVIAYTAAAMSQSVPINLYSALLGRQGVYSLVPDNITPDEARRKDISQLAQYTIESLRSLEDAGTT